MYILYTCRLMRRQIKVTDPFIFLVSAAYMHIREEVVDDNNIIIKDRQPSEPAALLASRRHKAAGSLGWCW